MLSNKWRRRMAHKSVENPMNILKSAASFE